MDLFPRHKAAIGGIGGRTVDEQPKLIDEIKKMECEPLMPVEKRLIGWSIGLGIALLGLLILISRAFFPTGLGR